MKKTLISFAVASALAVPATSAFAVDVSGFADVQLTVTDDSTKNTAGPTSSDNPREKQFSANGEVDFTHAAGDVTVRADVDLNLRGATLRNGSTADSASLEQALVVWKANQAVTVIGGVFNSPIGQDAEDIVDQRFTSHSAVYNVLDHQTALDGNNVAGIAVAGMLGPATVTAAVLNDLGSGHGVSTTTAAGKNSLALNINLSPSAVPGLDLELGFASQESYKAGVTGNPSSAGNVIDFNVSYNVQNMVEVGLDYLKPSDIVDSAYDVWIKGSAGMGVDLGLRYSSVSWDSAVLGGAVSDNSSTAFIVSKAMGSNLDVALEYRSNDGNVANGGTITPSLVTTTNAVSGLPDGTQTWINIIGKF